VCGVVTKIRREDCPQKDTTKEEEKEVALTSSECCLFVRSEITKILMLSAYVL
jgi:hypothetical protein